MVRFIHTADWQLGMTRAWLRGEAQARFTQARLDAINTIGRHAVENDAAFILVCGDVYDANWVDPQTVARSLDALAGVPKPIYLLPGNHEPLNAGGIFRQAGFTEHKPPNVIVLDSTDPIRVAGVELVPAPWTSKRPVRNPADAVLGRLTPTQGIPRILAAHGGIDSTNPNPDNPALLHLDPLETALATGCLQYIALGDHHSHAAIGTTGRIHYPGAPEPTDYDEQNPGKCLLVEIEATRCDVKELPVASWRFVRHAVELAGDTDLDPLEVWLDALPQKPTTTLKLGLTGTLSLRGLARLETMLERTAQLLGGFQRWDRESRLVVNPDAADLDALRLSGFAQAALDELRARLGSSDAQAAAAQDAIALLWRLAASGG
jgi:DNA repair exonuclease SbcCD nuclease subunit